MTYSRELDILHAHVHAAEGYAKLSRAKRLQVGAVLIKDDRIISVGYNGTPSGRDNTCEEDGKTKPEVVHAEMNVIAFAAKNGVATNQCIMVITHSPCYECSKLIIQSGIKQVVYVNEYRLTEGIEFLKECGIGVLQYGKTTSRTT